MILDLPADSKATGIRIVAISPETGDVIPFSGALIDSSQSTREGYEERNYDLFQYINEYWTLKCSVQENIEIFKTLGEARKIIEYTADVLVAMRELKPVIARLIALHDFNRVRNYLSIDSNIVIPQTAKEAYDNESQSPGTRAQTYLREEYIQLVTMSTILRVVYPIFVSFIYKYKGALGTSRKELYAFSLLEESYLMAHPAMDRLVMYIDGCVNKKAVGDLNIIVKGSGTEDFPRMILATVVVKKVSCGDIRGTNITANLISNLWQCVRGMLNDRNNPQGVKGKILDENASDGDNKNSRTEQFKIKQALCIGDVSMIRHSARQHIQLAIRANKVSEQSDIIALTELVSIFEAFATAHMLQGDIQDCQITVAQYVLSSVFPPRAWVHLDKVTVINLLAVAQATLWRAGFYPLAGLLTATEIPTDEFSTSIATTGGRIKLDSEILSNLMEQYSIIDYSEKRKQHPVIQSLYTLTEMFGDTKWMIHLPPDMVKQITGSEFVRDYETAGEFTNQLASMLLHIVR